MKIALGCDHNGLLLKQAIIQLLKEMNHEAVDLGCYDTTSVDYPDVAKAVAQAVAQGQCQHGMLVCGTGIGMSMAANKVKGVRAALCHDVFSARRAREHNDANVLCMGGQVVGVGPALEVVKSYLSVAFEGGRHARRVGKIVDMEKTGTSG